MQLVLGQKRYDDLHLRFSIYFLPNGRSNRSFEEIISYLEFASIYYYSSHHLDWLHALGRVCARVVLSIGCWDTDSGGGG
jgi:hypothetical protein